VARYLTGLPGPVPLPAGGQLAASPDRGAADWLLPWAARHSAVATRQKSTARRLVSIGRGDCAVSIANEADPQAGTVPMLCVARPSVT
jgi:hypothetical protein